MGEIFEVRVCKVTGRISIISEIRKKRPKLIKEKNENSEEKICPFCPGNEHLTPPEIFRLEGKKGEWITRVFNNKYPALNTDKEPKDTSKEFFYPYGYHLVVVDNRHHYKDWDYSGYVVKNSIITFREITKKILEDKKIKEVLIFKNMGKESGASIIHPHSQIIATPFEIFNFIKNLEEKNCYLCKEKSEEMRKIIEVGEFVAKCPFAPSDPYEVWIFPKRHIPNILKLDEEEITDLSNIINKILIGIKKVFGRDISLNIIFIERFIKEDFHMFVMIVPVSRKYGGYEKGTFFRSFIVNTSPETSSKEIKNAIQE